MTEVTVFACTRCDLSGRKLPEGVSLLEVPCTGRVSIPLLLATMARGADGVIVLGRHQQTCRLNGAEDPARDRTARAADVLRYAGYGERIRFANPEPGLRGPVAAVEKFASEIASLGPKPNSMTVPQAVIAAEGLDTSLDLARWMATHETATADIGSWIRESGLPEAKEGGPAFIAGIIPFLDRLTGDLLRPVRVTDMVRMAIDVLRELGFADAGVWHEPWPADDSTVLNASSRHVLCRRMKERLDERGVEATPLSDLLIARFTAIPRPPVRVRIAYDGSTEQKAVIEALGHEPVDVGHDPLPDSFALSREDRVRAEARLAAADAAGAAALLVPGHLTLARWAMLTRDGTWRSTRTRPVLPHTLAWLSLRGLPVTDRSLTDPFASATRKVAS